MRTAIAFLLLTACAVAEQPTPTIDGPREVHSGALVTLDASGSDGAEAFGWLVDTSAVKVPGTSAPDVTRQVSELEALGFEVKAPESDDVPLYEVEDGGKRLRLSSYPGTYRVTLGVSNADGVAMLEWTVKVDAVSPGPGPKPDNPDPPPIVEPDLPAGQFGLAIKSWRAAQKVTSANRPEEARTLGVALLGTFLEPDGQAMVNKFAADMKAQFSAEQKAAWEPWRQSYLAELKALQDAGKLNGKQDWIAAFGEMSIGLLAVEK